MQFVLLILGVGYLGSHFGYLPDFTNIPTPLLAGLIFTGIVVVVLGKSGPGVK